MWFSIKKHNSNNNFLAKADQNQRQKNVTLLMSAVYA